MSKKNLLINLSVLFNKPTGIGTYLKSLFPYLQSLNPTLLIAQIAQEYSSFECHIIPKGMTPADGTKGHLRRLLWTQFQLPNIYRQLEAQLLFSPIPEAPLYHNKNFVTTAFDLIPLRFPRRFPPLSFYHKYYTPQVFEQAKHILSISESTANDLIQFYGVSSEKITPILLGYDRDHFKPIDIETEAIEPYFLYIGRHDTYKNLQRLIEAFWHFRQGVGGQDFQLHLVGPFDSRYTPQLQQQVHVLGLTAWVKFIDYAPYAELPKIISGAIALVFPSLWEGFGLPVLEAMGCGTPVITSNISSLPEVAGDAAILIDPYRVEEITDAMQAIANDSGLRSRLSQLGLERVKQFSWQKTGEATAEILKRFL